MAIAGLLPRPGFRPKAVVQCLHDQVEKTWHRLRVSLAFQLGNPVRPIIAEQPGELNLGQAESSADRPEFLRRHEVSVPVDGAGLTHLQYNAISLLSWASPDVLFQNSSNSNAPPSADINALSSRIVGTSQSAHIMNCYVYPVSHLGTLTIQFAAKRSLVTVAAIINLRKRCYVKYLVSSFLRGVTDGCIDSVLLVLSADPSGVGCMLPEENVATSLASSRRHWAPCRFSHDPPTRVVVGSARTIPPEANPSPVDSVHHRHTPCKRSGPSFWCETVHHSPSRRECRFRLRASLRRLKPASDQG